VEVGIGSAHPETGRNGPLNLNRPGCGAPPAQNCQVARPEPKAAQLYSFHGRPWAATGNASAPLLPVSAPHMH
jgi:hypothetical protein